MFQDDNEPGDVIEPLVPGETSARRTLDEIGSGGALGYINGSTICNYLCVFTQVVRFPAHLYAYPMTVLFLNTKSADYVLVHLQSLHA